MAFRYAESNPLSEAHDAVGFSLGMNLDRHLGLELAADFYELQVEADDVGTIGELATGALIPQLRLRYPLLDDRLVPYLIGGAGLSVTQFNDRSQRAPGKRVRSDDGVAPIGALGGGIEYHIADNVALGVESKYLIGSEQTVSLGGLAQERDLSAGLLAFSMRLLYPQLDPGRAASSGASGTTVFYFGLRAGGAMPVDDDVFPGIEAEAEPASIGGTFNQLFGLALGVNTGRHLGVELPFEGYEMRLRRADSVTLGEYALYAVIPHLRARWPLLDDRLEPYALGGVGVTYGEFNDTGATAGVESIDSNDISLAGTLGAGLEYFVTTNIAIGAEARYLFAGDHDLQINAAPALSGNFDSLLLTVSLRVFLFEW